jgi:hypothetical protein
VSAAHKRVEQKETKGTKEGTPPNFAAFGLGVMRYLRDHIDELSEELSGLADLAVRCGLAEDVVYDPALHGEGIDAMPGEDRIYWLGPSLPWLRNNPETYVCTCGKRCDPSSSEWRFSGYGWQHHHGYPIGHVHAFQDLASVESVQSVSDSSGARPCA